MQYDWILDVLTDLRSFAHENGMIALAEHLDDTTALATSEIANSRPGSQRIGIADQNAQDLSKGAAKSV